MTTRTCEWTDSLTQRVRQLASRHAHGDRSEALAALRTRLHAMRRTSDTDTRQYVESEVRELLRDCDAYLRVAVLSRTTRGD